jgi:hypothetical protein
MILNIQLYKERVKAFVNIMSKKPCALKIDANKADT